MRAVWIFLALLPLLGSSVGVPANGDVADAIATLTQKLDDMQVTVRDLARQTMLQQFAVEERVRSEGSSGVKLVRGTAKGLQNYHEATHISNAFNSIHDHSNNDRTMGMGEVIAVLNGVEFRTRHNDYKLKMPSQSDTNFHVTEDIPFPGVPPAVSELTDVQEQVAEMREWFKAFSTQNVTHRDYRPYFKATLCYMEGAWTLDKELEEPFESDRHHLDASSWFELQNLVRYASYTGTKSRLENYAYLPTTIMSVNTTTGLPNYAQWNYRIICSPIERDIPTKYMKPAADLSHLVGKQKSKSSNLNSRGQRFRFYELDDPMSIKNSLIDELFYEIPGKDNLPGNLNQSGFGEEMYTMDNKPLNTGYYHRFFKFAKKGAMGLSTVARGFNDANCWVAETTQKRVAPIGLKVCTKNRRSRPRKTCEMMYTRFSYAIPLEIIYRTPLLSWNPYNLVYHEDGDLVTEGGRTGSSNKPYNGVGNRLYYMTPVEFFTGRTDNSDKADTVKKSVSVKGPDGVTRKTTASGTRIILPNIDGVGQIRLRYPITPVHGEGSSVWKELNAAKTFFTDGAGPQKTAVTFQMTPTTRNPPGEHTHEFVVSMTSYNQMINDGAEVTVTTTENQGHTHTLNVKYNKGKSRFEYNQCGMSRTCWDEHPKVVTEME